MEQNRKILYCILDWGLGHAARSVPIIKHLTKTGFDVTIATSRELYLTYLKHELDQCGFFELQSYSPYYSKHTFQQLTLLMQLPNFLSVFLSDRIRVKKFVKQNQPYAIISDNRFSCWSRSVKSYYITHQINILRSGTLLKWHLASLHHQKLIRKFNACLVPDIQSKFSGSLSKTKDAGLTIENLGILSRFHSQKVKRNNKNILVILSGPEPQRTILETKVLNAAVDYKDKIVLVRGTDKPLKADVPDNVVVINIADSVVLLKLFEDCSYVICRSGYTSVMDLLVMKIPAVLIPTPGQSEQEYIAKHMKESGIFEVLSQKSFRFPNAHDVVANCNIPNADPVYFKDVLIRIIQE